MRVSGIKGGAPRASPLPQDMLYTFSGRCILSGGKGELLLHAWYKHRLRDEYSCLVCEYARHESDPCGRALGRSENFS